MGRMTAPSALLELTVAPPALAPLPDAAHIERELRNRLQAHPDDALASAALGNVLARRSRYAEALDAYEAAIACDPAYAQACLAAAEIAHLLRDEARADMHLRAALGTRRYYGDPRAGAPRARIALLLRDAPYSVNAPLELLLDPARVAIDKCYVAGYGDPLPSGVVAMTAFGWWSGGEPAIDRASTYAPLNDPRRLERCARHRLAMTLRDCTSVVAVDARRVAACDVPGIATPCTMRPEGTQAGRGLAFIDSVESALRHAARFPAEVYEIAPFVDYRSPDGYFRKYRIVFVDGVAYPYHLAISSRWIVHYQTSAMGEFAWMREEERRFLADPGAVFADWHRATQAIGDAIGLEYVGMDLACLPDGRMLVFEADPAMLVHDEEPDGIFAYKRPHVSAIREALTAVITSRSAHR